MAKKREFEAVLQERKIHLDDLQKKYEEQKRELETLNRAKEEAEEQMLGDPAEDEESEPVTAENI